MQETFASAKSKVADGDKVNVNCVSPTMWALKEMGLLAQGTNFYSTTDGRWHGMNENQAKGNHYIQWRPYWDECHKGSEKKAYFKQEIL